MARIMIVVWVLFCAVVVAAGYVRLAPSDPADWNAEIEGDGDEDFRSGVRREIPAGPETFETLERIILATPRTTRLAGSTADGRATYVTRSALWGFPDYATVELRGQRIVIYSRARFGRSDMGVNRKRVTGWLDALKAG